MRDSVAGQGETKRTTLIEEGTAFKGEFASDCPIVVKGRIEGNISGPSLTVSATGSVAGVVKVGVIESEGELSGEFEAETIRLSGRVRDNTIIRARSLEVKLAPEKGMMQVVFGECALDVGDMPSKEQVMSESLAETASTLPKEPTPSKPPSRNEPVVQNDEASSALVVVPTPATPIEASPSGSEAQEVVVAEASEKFEKKNGFKGKGGRPRNSEMPPAPA
jgi:cytoskeletal protein CcmA (bactofilin family)